VSELGDGWSGRRTGTGTGTGTGDRHREMVWDVLLPGLREGLALLNCMAFSFLPCVFGWSAFPFLPSFFLSVGAGLSRDLLS